MLQGFAKICADYRNLPAFTDEYSSKLAFWCQNTIRILTVSSGQVICVQHMSPLKLFVHQLSSSLVNTERVTLAMHTTDVFSGNRVK